MAGNSIEDLYALTIPKIQEAFLSAMQDIVDRALLNEMVKAIENNDVEALFKATGFTPAALSPLLDEIEQSYLNGAQSEVSTWPKVINSPTGLIVFRYNLRNRVVENDLRDYSSSLVSNLTEEARTVVKNTLQRGMISGKNPRSTALDIVGRINPITGKREGGILGLNSFQEQWVVNAKRYLEQLDKKYFDLNLRDKRFDSIVKKAIENNIPITTANIDKLLTAYKSKILRYRGETIARTETIQSLNRGAYSSFLQAIDEGTLNIAQITKEWDDVRDKRVRHTHRSMGNKYNKNHGIDLQEPFVSPSGARLMFPGDISLGAGAKEVTNCRCKNKYRVNWRYGLENG